MRTSRFRFTLAGLLGVVLLAATACWLEREHYLFDYLKVWPILLPLLGLKSTRRQTRVFCLSFASIALAHAVMSANGPALYVDSMFKLVRFLTPSRLNWRLNAWIYTGLDLLFCMLVALVGGFAVRNLCCRVATPSRDGGVVPVIANKDL